MSTIKSTNDPDYVLKDSDVIPLVNKKGMIIKGATKEQVAKSLGGWRDVQVEIVEAEIGSIVFNIPSTAKMARIVGLIVSPAATVIQPAITFNGLTTSIYNFVRIDTTDNGDLTPDEVTDEEYFEFTSAFSSGEQCLIDIQVPVSNQISRQLFKSTGFNNGGVNGDYHTCVGWAADSNDITSIELKTISPFANNIGVGSFFTLSILELLSEHG